MSKYDEYRNEEEIPVIIADKDGVILFINEMFADTYLWKPDELIGQPLMAIIPANLQDAHNMGFSRYQVSGTPTLLDTLLDLEILMGNGKQVLAQHFISAIDKAGEVFFAAKISLR